MTELLVDAAVLTALGLPLLWPVGLELEPALPPPPVQNDLYQRVFREIAPEIVAEIGIVACDDDQVASRLSSGMCAP